MAKPKSRSRAHAALCFSTFCVTWSSSSSIKDTAGVWTSKIQSAPTWEAVVCDWAVRVPGDGWITWKFRSSVARRIHGTAHCTRMAHWYNCSFARARGAPRKWSFYPTPRVESRTEFWTLTPAICNAARKRQLQLGQLGAVLSLWTSDWTWKIF